MQVKQNKKEPTNLQDMNMTYYWVFFILLLLFSPFFTLFYLLFLSVVQCFSFRFFLLNIIFFLCFNRMPLSLPFLFLFCTIFAVSATQSTIQTTQMTDN